MEIFSKSLLMNLHLEWSECAYVFSKFSFLGELFLFQCLDCSGRTVLYKLSMPICTSLLHSPHPSTLNPHASWGIVTCDFEFSTNFVVSLAQFPNLHNSFIKSVDKSVNAYKRQQTQFSLSAFPPVIFLNFIFFSPVFIQLETQNRAIFQSHTRPQLVKYLHSYEKYLFIKFS